MIPRIGGKGRSFKGAMQYYLHDKSADGKALATSSERVEWVETHNLPTQDPQQATRHMIDTAMHADELKARAGVKATGRKSNLHVLTYSLAWKAGEQIETDSMRDACLSSMKALGISDHQAIFVRHGDTDHQHVHVIVNRVNPENGVLAKLKNDRLKLSKWAEEYELEYGGIQCEQRVENNEKRKSEYVKHEEEKRQDYQEEKARRSAFWDQVRKDRKNYNKQELAERKALFEAKEEQILNSRKLVKDAYKPQWRELFERQRDQMKDTKEEIQTAFGRAKFLLKERAQDWNRQGLTQYFRMVMDKEALYSAVKDNQAQERRDLAKSQQNQTRDQMRLINKSYKADRMSLDELHQSRRSEFDKQMDERVQAFRDSTSEQDRDTANDQGRERQREFKPKGSEPH